MDLNYLTFEGAKLSENSNANQEIKEIQYEEQVPIDYAIEYKVLGYKLYEELLLHYFPIFKN